MTIQAAIDMIDSLKVNTFENHQKVAWLSDLDGMVWGDIITTHEGVPDGVIYRGYDQTTEPDTVLLVPEPYTDIYKHYMAMQMDAANRDNNEYAKDKMLFNAAWQILCDYWNRKHLPISRVKQLRF